MKTCEECFVGTAFVIFWNGEKYIFCEKHVGLIPMGEQKNEKGAE